MPAVISWYLCSVLVLATSGLHFWAITFHYIINLLSIASLVWVHFTLHLQKIAYHLTVIFLCHTLVGECARWCCCDGRPWWRGNAWPRRQGHAQAVNSSQLCPITLCCPGGVRFWVPSVRAVSLSLPASEVLRNLYVWCESFLVLCASLLFENMEDMAGVCLSSGYQLWYYSTNYVLVLVIGPFPIGRCDVLT